MSAVRRSRPRRARRRHRVPELAALENERRQEHRMASTRKQEISEETRRRLVKAAAELAAEGGSTAMSVQAVAERSGISRGSVAWHFGSKDGLLRAVVEDAFRWGMEKLRAELASSSATGIEALIEANFVLMSYPEARIFSTILIEAVIPGPPSARPTQSSTSQCERCTRTTCVRSTPRSPIRSWLPSPFWPALSGSTSNIASIPTTSIDVQQ
ncbi:TetR/AcrR family transcriptional regulator [Rhodococcus sp. 3Y1]